jgi:trigger factor
MKVRTENAGGCRRILQVEVGPDGVSEAYGAVLESFRRVASIPGFRPGKAPAVLVQRRFAREIGEEARDRLLPRLYRDALAAEKLDVAAVADVSDVRLDPASGMSFRVVLDVVPEIKLPKYRKITLKDETRKVTGEDVDRAVTGVRERTARFEDASGRAIRRGDLVQMDYTGTAGGKPVDDICPGQPGIGRAAGFWAMIDDPEFLPGVNAGIEGMKAGETRKIVVAFPADYHVEPLKSLQAEYEITVKSVRERILPEVNAEFLKTLGVESEEKLRERLRSDLEKAAVHNEENRRRDEIARFLLENVACELPEAVVARETDHAARLMVRRFAYQGATRDEIEKRSEEILGVAHRSSSDRVKLQFILKRIAAEEKVEVSDKDIDDGIAAIAAARNQKPDEVRSELEEHDSMDGFRDRVLAGKTMDFLLESTRAK